MNIVRGVLIANPLVTGSEKRLEAIIEDQFLLKGSAIRIGINYHGQYVQHVQLNDEGNIAGWNPEGDVFRRGSKNKMIMKKASGVGPTFIFIGDPKNLGC